MLALGACVLVPGMLRMFFALALMPLVVEMVAAYARLRWTSYTFWILGTGMLDGQLFIETTSMHLS